MASTCPKCAQAGAGKRQAINNRHRVISWSFNRLGQRHRRTSVVRLYPTITVCIPSLGQPSTMLRSGPSTSSTPCYAIAALGANGFPTARHPQATFCGTQPPCSQVQKSERNPQNRFNHLDEQYSETVPPHATVKFFHRVEISESAMTMQLAIEDCVIRFPLNRVDSYPKMKKRKL